MKKILIGIPVLDNVEMTRTCLEYLFRNTKTDTLRLRVSVLIVDNGSQVPMTDVLRKKINVRSLSSIF